MKTTTLEVPAMYGDHHVIEVRRLLLEVPGVNDVYASSSFKVVEITFDDKEVSQSDIEVILERAGYLGELPVPEETGAGAAQQDGKTPFFRHSSAFEHTREVVSFAQNVPYAGRPLWPCPGMGPIQTNKN